MVKCVLLVLALILVSFGRRGSCGMSSESDEGPSSGPGNPSSSQFKEAVFIYPPGIRSERDIPVCTKWVSITAPSEDGDFSSRDDPPWGESPKTSALTSNSGDDMFLQSQNSSSVFDILVEGHQVAQGNPGKPEEGVRWESACNIVHKRFFYPPVVERLCRCPDRTECPWMWSQPPSYPNSPVPPEPGAERGTRDPFSIMISSRSQAKFCTEVTTGLPRCQNPRTGRTKGGKKGGQSQGAKEKELPLSANLVKSVRRTSGGEEIPKVTVNCYCPPLFRQWNYVGHTEPTDFGNGTLHTNFYYRCERLGRCRRDDHCGNIRTDLHFSFYHCTCPREHLCLPKIYPPESVDDVEEEVNEALFRGQVAPAYCTPYQHQA